MFLPHDSLMPASVTRVPPSRSFLWGEDKNNLCRTTRYGSLQLAKAWLGPLQLGMPGYGARRIRASPPNEVGHSLLTPREA